MIELREARPEDIAPIAAAMRAMDARECRAFGHEPASGLEHSLLGSRGALTVAGDAGPIGMLGVTTVSALEGLGAPWMLGTDAMLREMRAWARFGPPVVAWLMAGYARLENAVHRDNAPSIVWLRHFGFTLGDGVEQIGGEPFRRFWKCA